MGEAPGHNEVREKHAFIGKSGDLLNRIAGHLGIDRREILIGNAILCGPINEDDKARPEFHDALVRCRERREAEGDLAGIEVVLAAGGSAAEGLTGDRVVLGGRQPRRGALHRDPQGRAVFPTWHPAALLRAGGDSSKGGKKAGGGLSDAEVETFGFDMERSWQFACGQRKLFQPVVTITDRPSTFVSWVQANAMRASMTAIDVETDSVDPTTASLLSVGLAIQTPKGETRAISFWWPGADAAALEALRRLLTREEMLGVYHNCQYDLSVLERHIVAPRNRVFDTMLAMHAAFPECKLDLGSVSHTFLVVPPWKFLFREWERKNKKQVEARSAEWIRRLSEYNALDAACTVANVDPLRVECEKRKVLQIADLDVEQALIARKMTERGLYISEERRAELRTNFEEHERKALDKLSRMVVEAVQETFKTGLHGEEVEKLLAEIQKSSNKGLPKPRLKKIKAKKPKKRRKKKDAVAQLWLAATAVWTVPQSGALPVPVVASSLPGSDKPAEHPPAEPGPGMVLDLRSADSTPPADPPAQDQYTVVYPPIPDKVWRNKAWNPLSTAQLRLAFDICGVQLPANAVTKKGQRSLSKHVLVQVFDHPIVGAVIEARKYRRLLSVYFESEGSKIAEDHRLRVGWKVHGTPTGRWSSGAGGGGVGDIGIAVQNWPVLLRRMVVAPPGYSLVGADYCVAPETKILRRDLRWTAAADVAVGDELVAFEESLDSRSEMRPAVVEAVGHRVTESFRVVTDRGEVICSGEHRWPVLRPCVGDCGQYRRRRWMKTSAVKQGDAIPFLCDPWDADVSLDGSYLAGFLDGEGSVAAGKRSRGGRKNAYRVGFGQNPGPLLDHVNRLIAEKGFATSFTVSESGCRHYRFVGRQSGLRVLGQLRPVRLLPLADRLWVGRHWSRTLRKAIVRRVEPIGRRRVISIRTSTGTFVANGFLSHNSQLEFRMIALLSGETTLLDVFNDPTGGRDLHSENAARLYEHVWTECDPTSVVDPLHGGRLDAKQVKAITKLHDKNVPLPEIAEQFGWSELGLTQVLDFAGRRVLIRKFTKTGLYAAVYGAVPPTVQSQLRAQSLKETDPKFARMLREVSLKQCQTFVDAVPRFWPKLSRWREEQISIRQRTGVWVCPWSGRRRVWPMGRVDPTQTVNTPVQGASGSLMNDRFVTLGRLLPPDVHIILQVHDSVTLEAPQAIANDVKQLVEKTMTATLEHGGHRCLFTVEAAVGPSWDVV